MENTEPEIETQEQPSEEEAIDLRETEIAALKESLGRTLTAYRDSLIRLNPELPAELLGGDTLEAVDESVARARTLVSKVKQGLEAERVALRVPAGSPLRSEADFSGLSPRQKIQIGIGGN